MNLPYEISFEASYDAKRAYFELAKISREEEVSLPTILFHQMLPLKFEVMHLSDGTFHLLSVREKLEVPRAMRLITRELMTPKPDIYDYPEDALVHNTVPDMAPLYASASRYCYDAAMTCPQVVVLDHAPEIEGFAFGPYYPRGDVGKATAVFLRQGDMKEMTEAMLRCLKEAEPRTSAF